METKGIVTKVMFDKMSDNKIFNVTSFVFESYRDAREFVYDVFDDDVFDEYVDSVKDNAIITCTRNGDITLRIEHENKLIVYTATANIIG